MITRELITNDIDQLQEHYWGFLHRIIRALIPVTSMPSISAQEQVQDESWEDFLQNTYGVFRDEPVERGIQGNLEIREALE